MREGRSSKTAEHNALFRALEARRPPAERLVDDHLAEAFLSLPYGTVARLARARPARNLAVRVIDGRWPGVRTSVVARTRLIDDTVAGLVGDLRQVVLLGAGYDTRPYRLECLAGVTTFEVDHPDTQRRKREILEQRAITQENVSFVATDFHLGRLSESLAQAGFDQSAPTLFLWEGVTNYLSQAAVDATLSWCAGAAPGSRLVFTYIDVAVLIDPGRYRGAKRVFSTLQRVGEEMTFGMAPDEAAQHLEDLGLILESDVGAASYRELYYGSAAARMNGHEFYRVARARVPTVTS